MFLSNNGSSPALPFNPAVDRYIQLSHPALANVLLLNQFADDGKGYSLPQLTGQLVSKGRAREGSAIVLTGQANKKEWRDMAFVVTHAQSALLEQLALIQSAVTPLTLVDNMLLTYLTVSVVVVLPDGYKTSWGGIQGQLVQFSILEV